MTGNRSQTSPVGSPSSGDAMISLKEQDRFLPIANVSRIMKKSLPANAKISKEAKETVQECVSEYISFITGEASDKCQREKRKTINGDDLLWAMTILGFENYVGPLRNYLGKYRETEGDKTSMARHGDQQSLSTDSCTDHGTNYSEIHRSAMISSSTPANSVAANADFQRLRGGFYSFGTKVNPDGYGASGRLVTGYEENTVIGAFKGNEYCENGDGKGNRAVEAHHLHHQVGW